MYTLKNWFVVLTNFISVKKYHTQLYDFPSVPVLSVSECENILLMFVCLYELYLCFYGCSQSLPHYVIVNEPNDCSDLSLHLQLCNEFMAG